MQRDTIAKAIEAATDLFASAQIISGTLPGIKLHIRNSIRTELCKQAQTARDCYDEAVDTLAILTKTPFSDDLESVAELVHANQHITKLGLDCLTTTNTHAHFCNLADACTE